MSDIQMSTRITRRLGVFSVRLLAPLLLAPLMLAPAAMAAEGHGGEPAHVNWQDWKANNQIGDQASLQRGAANYANYCASCHSLKYLRYERMAKDLGIPDDLLRKNLLPDGAKPTDYMMVNFPQADAEAWFGKLPPDLSLITRSKGSDYVYQFLKGFYVDQSTATKTNNLALPGAAMPAVLSELEGVKRAVFAAQGAVGGHGGGPVVERFEEVAAGSLSPEKYDAFVRDTVNYLSYAGEPSQLQRNDLGIWVVLFLLVFTGFAWLLKREYWRDVH
jgi:ubiquinol-cytochrome c reductase cytochrome c1 subunit